MKTVMEMAKEAGWDEHHAKLDLRFERFAALVRDEERKLCLSICAEIRQNRFTPKEIAKGAFMCEEIIKGYK